MKIKKITNNKIKIFLSLEDMNICHISKDLLSKTKGKIRDSFRITEENKLLIKNLKRNDIIKK